jgi:gamma-glutamyltranspeptidase/glutathione hydrolase
MWREEMDYDSIFRSRRSNVMAMHGMVATSQPLAAMAGLEILRMGGNAADAAVATAAMLNVVEPISTGIGGDVFALYWDAGARTVKALNGSGRAAKSASVEALRQLGYDRMPTYTGHAVTVPGTVAGWSDLLEGCGTMRLADVLAPAIRTAEEGYPVTEWIAEGWKTQTAKLLRSPEWHSGDSDNGPPQPSGAELLLDGRAPRAGEVMRIATLAETLRAIAAEGPSYVYQGEFAIRLSEHVQRYAGWLSPEDLAAHRSTWEEPISARYRGVTVYECPPNGQGLVAIVALNLAQGCDLAEMGEAERAHTMIECMNLAFAVAGPWIADPAMVALPLEELVSPAFADWMRGQIRPDRALESVQRIGPAPAPTEGDTVYLSVVDGAGNACSLINSLYMGTGTGLVVPGTGVALQNRGALFALDAGHPNSLAPGKRPYHTIIPALACRDDALYASLGVMGGYMQPQGHLQVLVNLVDLGMSPQQALDIPRWQVEAFTGSPDGKWRRGPVYVEEGWSPAVMAALAEKGHALRPMDGFDRRIFGGGQVIVRNPETGVLTGGSDSRKDGCAVGW